MFVADSKKNSLTDFTQLLRLDAVADPDLELRGGGGWGDPSLDPPLGCTIRNLTLL